MFNILQKSLALNCNILRTVRDKENSYKQSGRMRTNPLVLRPKAFLISDSAAKTDPHHIIIIIKILKEGTVIGKMKPEICPSDGHDKIRLLSPTTSVLTLVALRKSNYLRYSSNIF